MDEKAAVTADLLAAGPLATAPEECNCPNPYRQHPNEHAIIQQRTQARFGRTRVLISTDLRRQADVRPSC